MLVLNTNSNSLTNLVNSEFSTYIDVKQLLLQPLPDGTEGVINSSFNGILTTKFTQPEIYNGINGTNFGNISYLIFEKTLGPLTTATIGTTANLYEYKRFFLDGGFSGGEVIGKTILGDIYIAPYFGRKSGSGTVTVNHTINESKKLKFGVYLYHTDGTYTTITENIIYEETHTNETKGSVLLYDSSRSIYMSKNNIKITTNGVVAEAGDKVGVKISQEGNFELVNTANTNSADNYEGFIVYFGCRGGFTNNNVDKVRLDTPINVMTMAPAPIQISIE